MSYDADPVSYDGPNMVIGGVYYALTRDQGGYGPQYWKPIVSAPTPTASITVATSTGVNPVEQSYSLYGHIIPLSVFGVGRIGGEIIAGSWVENGLASFIISFGVPADPSGSRDIREIAFDSEVVWSTSGASGVTTAAGGTFNTEAFTFRFYGGTLTQSADALETSHFGTEANAYRPQLLIAFENLPLANTKFGKIPYVAAVIGDSTGNDVNLGEAFERLAYSPWVGWTSSNFETLGITDGLVDGGLIIAQDSEFLSLIQQFGRFYPTWDILQTDKLRIVDRGSIIAPDVTLNATRLMGKIAVNRQGQDTVKKDLELSTIDPGADYTIVPSVAQRPRDPVAVTTSVGKDAAYLPAIMDASTRAAVVTLAKYHEERTRKTVSGTAMAYGLEIEPGDLVAIRGLGTDFNNETFKVVETLHGANYSVEFTAASFMKCTADTQDSSVNTPLPLLTGLIGWYDASVFSSLTISGSTITRVADQSGAGNHLGVSLFIGIGPLYDPVGLNARPTMTFVSANTRNIAFNNFLMGSGNTLTFFWVGTRANAGNSNSRAISYAQPGAAHDFDNAPSWNFSRNGSTEDFRIRRNSVNEAQSTASISYDTPVIAVGTINSSGLMTLYINGVASAPATSSGNWVTNGSFCLGAGTGSIDTGSHWDGKMSEVGIATGFSDAAKAAEIYAYLKDKWGL